MSTLPHFTASMREDELRKLVAVFEQSPDRPAMTYEDVRMLIALLDTEREQVAWLRAALLRRDGLLDSWVNLSRGVSDAAAAADRLRGLTVGEITFKEPA